MEPPREDSARMSIDTVYDWNRVKDDYRKAALEKLNTEGLGGPEREALLKHLEQVRVFAGVRCVSQEAQHIERVFQLAQPNLRVNGHNFDDADAGEQDTDTFDEALDRHIWSLANNRLNWNQKIAETRRTKPKAIATALEETFSAQHAQDASSPPTEAPLSDENDAGNPDLQDTLEQVAALGQELDQAIPIQTERAQRFNVAVTEMKSLK
ncbi:hypothetical protein HGRIS_008337 [Hohenbuehelia grisea]|uniref:Uncharacterized protein n=1 Tax=Hohenbuehelia grisea TaxID=104357 RepID=A0ABR3J7X0_9AGAR